MTNGQRRQPAGAGIEMATCSIFVNDERSVASRNGESFIVMRRGVDVALP